MQLVRPSVQTGCYTLRARGILPALNALVFSSRMRTLLSPALLLSTLLSVGTAFVLSILCRDYAVKAAVPVTFLLALAAVALVAGRKASLVVAIVAGFIFAVYLFEPYGSLAVRSAVDRLDLLVFALAATGVVYFSPGPEGLTKTPSFLLTFEDGASIKSSDRLETWIAVVGYAVVLTAIVTLLLNVWNSRRY